MKNILPFLIILNLLLGACSKDNGLIEEEPEPTLEEQFTTKYNVSEEVWYIYPETGYSSLGRKKEVVAKISLSNGKYHCYIDDAWQFVVTIAQKNEDVLFFNINSNSGVMGSSGSYTYFDMVGATTHEKLDYPSYHGSFDSKTEKFQACYKMINLEPNHGFYILVFYEGYKQ